MAARPQKLIVCAAVLAATSAVTAQPRATRIVSLVPAVTEILFAIGAGPQVVGVSSYDEDPPEVLKLPRVGALLDPDVERIFALRPDLVVTYGSQNDLNRQLATAGVRTFSYRHGGLAEMATTFRQLGELTGRTEQAGRTIGTIEQRLDAVRARTAGRPRPRTVIVFSREPQSIQRLQASGAVGFLSDMLTIAGGENVFSDMKRESVPVSTELLLTRAPEVIVDLHYTRALSAAEVEKERTVWRALPSIPAVKTGRVYVLVGDQFVVPGPRVAGAVEELARLIHPEAFK